MRSNSMLAAPLRALPWKGMGVLLAVCLVNALRRNVNSRLLRDDPAEWLVDVRSATATGAIVAVLVVLAVMAASRPSWRAAWRYAATLTAALAASALGVMLLLGLESGWTYTAEFMQRRVGAVEMFANTWPRYLLLSCLFAIVYVYLRQRHEAEAEMRRLEVERVHFEQRTVEARVQRLQAQIEPHFLFNTLAHVKRLYQTDAATGKMILDNLMRYLAEALPQMRESHSSVRREIALTEAYLGIERIRMGRRLRFRIDMDDAAADVHLPPMMLLTLVENAIKHGLSALPEGGAIDVRCVLKRGRLTLSVIDDGKGFAGGSGSGTGLANIRARLATLYGAQAELKLASNAPRGVVASLELPALVNAGRSTGP